MTTSVDFVRFRGSFASLSRNFFDFRFGSLLQVTFPSRSAFNAVPSPREHRHGTGASISV